VTVAAESRLAGLADVALPVTELADVFLHLRRPFAPAAVRWKVQTEWGSGAVVIAYIDARLVVERLNAVCPMMWSTRYEAAPEGALRCHLTLAGENRDGTSREITRSDIGVGQGTAQMKVKATNSDALKRAAVMFGIGVSIYAMKSVRLNVGDADGELRTQEKKKKIGNDLKKVPVPVIDRRTEEWLAGTYARWLEVRGEPMFGPALDHGDDVGAQSMDETPAAAAAAQDEDAERGDGDAVAEVQQLDDDRARELRLEAEGWYSRLRRVAPRKLPPKAFREGLRQAGGSHEGLQAYVARLEELAVENESKAAPNA
jgi:hypothetical protein